MLRHVVEARCISLSCVFFVLFAMHVRQDEELEYLREKLEQLKQNQERAIDKALMERELEAAKMQAGVARSTVEVRLNCRS